MSTEDNALAVTYEADGQEINLNPAYIMKYVLGGQGSITEPEMAKTIMTCAARKLNPLSGDVHILPFNDKKTGLTKLNICPSIDFYQSRAMEHPKYRGIQDGIVVIANGVLAKKIGCAVYEELGERLIGGWAAVYVEGFEKPVCTEVSLKEYSTHKSLWNSKPATMINKVAKAQALRKAFPAMFQGLYEQSELGVDDQQIEHESIEQETEYIYDPEPIEGEF